MRRTAFVFLAALLIGPLSDPLLAGPLLAGTQGVEIEAMTAPEVGAAVAGGMTTIIIPTGGTEQNGPHMVLGKHNRIVAEAARRIAVRLGNALVAPVLAYTPQGDAETREGHMAFPGTISIAPEAFAGVLRGAAQSFKAHGFKTIVLLGDSGPNQAPQQALAAELSARWAAEGVSVINAAAYYDPERPMALLVAEGETAETIGTHAGIRDTSELMAVDRGGVRLDKRAADANGVSGDPTRASPERGERLLRLKVEAAVAEIAHPRASALLPMTAAPSSGSPSLLARLRRLILG